MTIAERGEARAQGALANFIDAMHNEVSRRDPEYRRAFWTELQRGFANEAETDYSALKEG